MEEETPKKETAVERLRTVTAELMRPVPYNAAAGPIPPQRKQEEKTNYGRTLWAGKFLILLFAAIGGIVGTVRVVKQLPVYRAGATIELSAPNSSFLGQGSLDPQAADSYVVNNANIQTQLRIIVGPGLLRKAVERVSLESPPLAPPSSGFISKIRNRFRLIPQDNTEFLRIAVQTAAVSVSARQIGTTHLLELTCESVSAEIAASFVNAVAAEYIAQSQQLRSSTATRTLQWLGTQLEDAKAQVDDAETKLQDFVKKQGLPFVLDQNTLADTKLRELQLTLSASQSDRIAKQSRFALAKSSPIDSLPEILDDGSLKGLNVQITALRKERALLTATMTSDHVKVKRIDSQIAELESTLQREKTNLVKRIENDYDAAVDRERLMTAAYNSQARAVANQADGASQFGSLKRDAETARAAYNQLSDRYKAMALVAEVPANNVRIIDAAVPVHVPSKPQPSRDITMAVVLGAALAAAFLIFRETIRIRKLSLVFASPGDTGHVLNVPELGTIPAFLPDGSLRRQSSFSLRGRRTAGSRDLAVPDLTSWSKQPFLAESIRHAVTSILVHGNGESHQVLVVTSASPEEGKTTLIGSLGVAMAEAGRRVLMVDADLRAPRLHSLFRLDLQPGLSDICAGNTPIADISLLKYVRETNIPNLFFLGGGEVDLQKLSEMLFSRRIRELFSLLRAEYDFVLVDTAPTLQFSDARLLGRISDGLILIIRSGVSSRENVQLTAQRIADDGISIVGTILNHWQPDLHGSSQEDYLGAYASPKAS